MKTWINFFLIGLCSILTIPAWANITVNMYLINKNGAQSIGTIRVEETSYGLLFIPKLQQLLPGIHGFHIHDHASCEHQGMAAMGHWDPQKTAKHLGPYDNKGHLGDLPALTVTQEGSATLPILAPRLTKLANIKHHALMIHAGGDNYADTPTKLGGGGDRIACGIIN